MRAGDRDKDDAVFMKSSGSSRRLAAPAVLACLTVVLGSAALAQITAPTVSAPSVEPSAAPSAAVDSGALGSSVVITVNDELISTYDVVQRMRLLIVTAGIQPTEQNIPTLQQEAARSLIDEHLEMQDLRKEGKEQKYRRRRGAACRS